MNRRKFLRYSAPALGLLVTGGATLYGYGTIVEPYRVEVVRQSIQLRRWKPGLEGLRAVQISDFHMGKWIGSEQLDRVVDLVLEQAPEVVFMTGDYLTLGQDYRLAMDQMSGPLKRLAGQVPVFSVMGNHDFDSRKPVELRDLLVALGIQDVTNTIVPYERNHDTLFIAGAGTILTGDIEMERVAAKAPANEPVILLAHEPDLALYPWYTPAFVLQLSGHSHGGQVRLPLVGPVVLPPWGETYISGLYEVEGMWLYTNRGIGMGRVPVRLNCPPEITVFTLQGQGT